MRNVPKYIRDHLVSALKHSQQMTEHIDKVEDWIRLQGLDPEDFRRGDGRGWEEIELGVDNVDLLLYALAVQGTEEDDLYG